MTEAVMEDVEVVEPAAPSAQVVPVAAPTLAVAPQVKPKELVDRLSAIKETMETAMHEGVDYGVIPGTDKPTLLKPGAEKLGVLFQLDVQIRNEQRFEADGHLTVTSRATVFFAPAGARLGYGEGVCTTRERKYAYRRQDLKCPDCGSATVLQSRKDDEPGFFCWRKKGGCGNTFAPDDDRLTKQSVGEVDNPDLPDLWNTVTKMAEKRARVDAVLAVTGASAIFTQDVEDTPAAAALDGGARAGGALPGWAQSLNAERAPEVLGHLDRVLGHDEARTILIEVHRRAGGIPAIFLPYTKAIADQLNGDPAVESDQQDAAAEGEPADVDADEPTVDPADPDVPPDTEGLEPARGVLDGDPDPLFDGDDA